MVINHEYWPQLTWKSRPCCCSSCSKSRTKLGSCSKASGVAPRTAKNVGRFGRWKKPGKPLSLWFLYGFYMVSMRFLPMITVYSIYSIRFYKIFRVFGENLTRFYSYLCGSTDVRFLQTWTQRTRNGRAWHQKIGFDQPSTCGHVSTQAEGHGRFLWLIWMIFLVVSLVVRQPNMTHFTSGQSSDGVPSGNLT